MATSALRTSGQKSSRVALLVSVTFGALSAILVVAYLSKVKSEGGTKNVATVPAVFATRDIPERTTIKEDMVEVRNIPVDVRHSLALTDAKGAVGRITRIKIAAGEQVLSSKLADDKREAGFSAVVPEGKRAVAVGVTEVIATGGHLSPGDYVDVIGVFEVQSPTDGSGNPINRPTGETAASGNSDKPKVYTAMTILQHVLVLAVAQQADPTLEPGGKDDRRPSRTDDVKTVTLAVTPEQAEKLALAEQLGKLRLSLRPFGETEQRPVRPVTNTLTDLAGQ
jgi:pilus assembly protein CpaB